MERRKNLNDKFGFVETMEVSLNEIGEIITGNTPSKSDTNFWNSPDICFIKPDVIADDEITELLDSNEYISENARNKARIVNENSILVTCIGSIAKIGIVKIRQCAFNQQINAIIPNKNIDTKYLCYCLQNSKVKLKAIANAPVVPIINKKQFGEFVVKIDGDISTQKKIANRLDYIQSVIKLYKIQLRKFDDLIKARFIEMFGDPVANTKNWGQTLLKEHLESIKYGTSTPPIFTDDGYAFIRATNIKNGKIVTNDMKYIPQEEADRLEKCKLSGGEIIIVRSGVNAGDTCVVTDEYIGQYAGYDMILVLSSDLHPVFFNTLINTEYMDKVVKPLTRRAAQPHLNSEQIQRLPIIEVPFELQEQFADFVQQVDKSREAVKKSLEKTQQLYDSLMQEYFG